MTKKEFLNILEKYLEGIATKTEKKLLDDFYHHYLKNSEEYWEEWKMSDRERVRVQLYQRLNQKIDEEVAKQKSNRLIIWRVAASVIFLLSVSAWVYWMQTDVPEVQYITKTTQKGQRATVKLSDGSTVQLNAESSITFPEKFTTLETRDIQLAGEAFFDVARDETKPFRVMSDDLVTTVLGTTFNIEAYPENGSILVTVATGKVKIEHSNSVRSKSQLLTPGQQGLFDKQSAQITKSEVDMDKYLAWRTGNILMENVTLEEAAEILSRWYDVTFVFRNPAMKNCMIDGKFRSDKLENILDNLKVLIDIEYQIEAGNEIILIGKSCD